jgi:hypothetical protein
VFNPRYATPDRFQIETFHLSYWTTNKTTGGELSNEARPIIIMNRRNLHQPLMFESKHHNSASKALRARALPLSSADVHFPALGVSAAVGGDVDVVVVAVARP